MGLGNRLKDHLNDDHSKKWDRFSWFGFGTVLSGTNENGICKLRQMAQVAIGKPDFVITDVEALLIRAMGLRNINQNNFKNAEEWVQIKIDELDRFLGRVA